MSTSTTAPNTITSADQKAIISRVLVAIDGSDSSMNAADHTISICKKYNAELYAVHATMVMTEKTRLDNSTYNILRALGKEADFMYSTVDKYIEDANRDNRKELVEIWIRRS